MARARWEVLYLSSRAANQYSSVPMLVENLYHINGSPPQEERWADSETSSSVSL